MTEQFGLLGRRLSHSLSPEIHAMFGTYPYALYEREPEELDEFFADTALRGCNVTIPYKVEAFQRCDELSDTARKIGSVNTVVRRRDGTLYGDNTDYFGFSYLAKRAGVCFGEKKVVVLGSGGASKTVQTVARDEGAREVVVVSRSGENNYDNLSLHADADVVVNTTPVGMYPNNLQSPLDLTVFTHAPAVLDLIYNPCRTALLLQARDLGLRYADGLSMLVAQALHSAEQFLQKTLDPGLINSVTQRIRFAQQNIVLIGMPGCGKSTVGAALAEKLGRVLLDTDAEVERAEGTTIPALFAAHGEAFFRNAETAACERVGKQLGNVIATGGGAILRTRNRDALRQNGVVVYLRRELSALARDGRPLSKDAAAVEAIFRQRKAIYETFADVVVDVDDDPRITTERVISCIC